MRNLLRALTACFFGAVAFILTLPILAAALPFYVVARLTAFVHRRMIPQTVPWESLCEFFPEIGWKTKAQVDLHAMADDAFHVITDDDGWRGSTTLRESDIVVFGDSHGFGHGIDQKDYFGNQTARARVKAIAANGYNMVQEVMWMRRLEPELAGKIVVWFIFLGNDIADNLEVAMGRYRSPYLRERGHDAGWEIVADHIQPTPWPFALHRYRAANYDRIIKVFSDTPFAERAFAACGHLLREGQLLCARAGARLVVFTIPDPLLMHEPGIRTLEAHGARRADLKRDLPDQRLAKFCHELGVPLIRGSAYLTIDDYKEFDDHWNSRGHRRVARILDECYTRHRATPDAAEFRTARPATSAAAPVALDAAPPLR